MKRTKEISAALAGTAHVRRDEPHWYLHVIDEGCVICGAGAGDVRVRVRGKAPKNPADRWWNDRVTYACGSHFC